MDRQELEQLVAGGESDRLEFKRSTGELREAMQTLCGFVNEQGGQALIGVTDRGRILGQQVADSTLRDVAQEITKFEPPVQVHQEQIQIWDDLSVLRLEVQQGEDGPHQFDGRAFQRIGTTTQRMPVVEYERRLLQRLHSRRRWENQIAEGWTIDDLDLEEISKTHRISVEVNRLDAQYASHADTLYHFGLRIDGHLTQAAVVLFGKKQLPDYPQCEVRMARFRGITKNEFIDQLQVRGHAFDLFDEAALFLNRHVAVAGWFEEGKWERQDRPQFPFKALREAIVNAICHRDYTAPGGAISIAMFDDRLEITNPGPLPQGITLAQLKQPHRSHPRNPLIAEPFFRRALIEKWGRGTQNIVEECVGNGYPEPEFFDGVLDVGIRFPVGDYRPPTRIETNLSERQQEILQSLGDGAKKTFRTVYGQLRKPVAERTVQVDMKLLRDLGLIDCSGWGRHARWWLVPIISGKEPET